METTSWICDTCGRTIDYPNDGWIEWLRRDDNSAFGLRLVHHNATENTFGCQYVESKQDATLQDMPMSEFVGDYGLMELLSLLEEGELPVAEVVEMIKRIHIGGYEKARKHIARAIGQGVFEPNRSNGCYTEYQIEAVNDWVDAGN